MVNLVNNWDSLLAYFSRIHSDVKSFGYEYTYEMQEIHNKLSDRWAYCLFIFLIPVVRKFESLNCLFQTRSVLDAHKAFDELKTLMKECMG